MRRTGAAGAAILSWFFYAYPAEYPITIAMDVRVERLGPFQTLKDCEARAAELEMFTRWRLRAGVCFPVVVVTK